MKTFLWIIAALLLSTNFIAFAEHCEDFSNMGGSKKTVYYNDDTYDRKSYDDRKYVNDDYDYDRYEKKYVYIEETPVIKKTIDEKKYYSTSSSKKKIKTVYINTDDTKYDYKKYDDRVVIRRENVKEVDKIITYTYYKDGSYSYEQAPANTVVAYVPKTSSSYKW